MRNILVLALVFVSGLSCDKEDAVPSADPYDFDVTLSGASGATGVILFRQNPDTLKVISLETKVERLQPNHEYLLQRAVDTQIDGNCTSTAWLTLGKGLTARSLITDPYGKGTENLWRDVTALASGSVFDIHFQVIDAVNSNVVLKSSCLKYTVR